MESCYLQSEAPAIECYSKPLCRIWLQVTSPACLLPMTEVFVQLIQNFLSLCSLIYALFSWETFPSQQYVNRELSDVQAGFRKGRGTRGLIAIIRWIIEKAKECQNNLLLLH